MIKDTTTKAAGIIQDESRKLKKHWFDKSCQYAIRNHSACRLQMLQDATEKNMQTYKEARNLINSIVWQQKKDIRNIRKESNLEH